MRQGMRGLAKLTRGTRQVVRNERHLLPGTRHVFREKIEQWRHSGVGNQEQVTQPHEYLASTKEVDYFNKKFGRLDELIYC